MCSVCTWDSLRLHYEAPHLISKSLSNFGNDNETNSRCQIVALPYIKRNIRNLRILNMEHFSLKEAGESHTLDFIVSIGVTSWVRGLMTMLLCLRS